MVRRYVNKRLDQTSIFLGLDLPYFLKGGFWLIGANIIAVFAGIFLSSIFARVWPRDVYGQFSFLTYAFTFLTLTSLPGMAETVFQGSIEKKDGVYVDALKRVIIFSLIGSVVLILGSIYFFIRDNSNLSIAVFFAAFAFPFTSISSLVTSFFNGKRLFRISAYVAILGNLASVAFTAFALLWSGNLVVVAIFSTWSTAIFNIILTFFALKKVENTKSDKKLLKFGFFMSTTNFVWLGLDYLDKLLIPLILGFSQNAIYAFAILIPLQMQNFLKPVITLGQPKVSEVNTGEVKSALYKKALQFEALVIVGVAVYIVLCPFIFDILYPTYESSVLLSQLFALTLLYYPNNIFGSYLTKKRIIGRSIQATVINAVVSILSLLIFIHLWGLIGAVVSKILTRVVQVLLTQFIFIEVLNKERHPVINAQD